jgi:hypothetical protein
MNEVVALVVAVDVLDKFGPGLYKVVVSVKVTVKHVNEGKECKFLNKGEGKKGEEVT